MATTAAIIARARRDVISHFMRNNSVSREQAVLFVPERHLQKRALARLRSQGVLVETAPHTYYLDVPSYDVWRHKLRQRMAALMLVIIIIAIAVGTWPS